MLPEAALALKQGAGRLIRSEADRGVLVICDSRLMTMGYGAELMSALPPMRVLGSQPEFEAALEQLKVQHAKRDGEQSRRRIQRRKKKDAQAHPFCPLGGKRCYQSFHQDSFSSPRFARHWRHSCLQHALGIVAQLSHAQGVIGFDEDHHGFAHRGHVLVVLMAVCARAMAAT
jgi:hypothetical protein